MKIIHTADWHIGKKLHKHNLIADFDLFIDWLANRIADLEVDLLLVSGDIFDLANPSSEAREQYYRSLLRLRKLDTKIILTGGNHDSPAMLDAPQQLLKELDISVVGGMSDCINDTIIPVKSSSGETELVVAAIPFLRDTDLRTAHTGDTYDDRLAAVRMGIETIFCSAAEQCSKKYPDIPAIAMGHLFATGAETSESERDIQIGNQAAFEANRFGSGFDYVALGHIHKPQRINATIPTYYSGSPIPLSFSEQSDEKRILFLDTEKSFVPQSIPVPSFRSLLKIKGTMSRLSAKLSTLPENNALDTLIEVELHEESYDAEKMFQLDSLISSFDMPGYEIVKHKTYFSIAEKKLGQYETPEKLEDVRPKDVFLKRISEHEYENETKKELLSAFEEILDEVYTEA
ncbi:exonuclease subunit SbcD [Pricia sp. S334]|uniref:Nuclease SbcCD subunit D n=1 Tax=Pricia mediterranea TaxID=3076079 RepID=A0ABU3L2K8_9FLAO|nr:exonuclease subunit SbcD [Pricia sp. S334]MDT7827975.1 exonuclease subunit SbcD [Pricia sp. S334]